MLGLVIISGMEEAWGMELHFSDLPFSSLSYFFCFLVNQKKGWGLVISLKSHRSLTLFLILEAKCVIRNLYWGFGKSAVT